MESYRKLLLNNKAWVQEKLNLSPDYFRQMAKHQDPKFLWIGCSDSRVPAEDVTGTQPGDIYVHRNIGNLVHTSDLNMLSALQYAVEVLNIKHIIVCGHYDCGGVEIALNHTDYGLMNKWLTNIKDVYKKYESDLNKIEDAHERSNKLVEYNVREQVRNLTKTAIIQKKWHTGQELRLHGWVYDVATGLINDLLLINQEDIEKDIYSYRF